MKHRVAGTSQTEMQNSGLYCQVFKQGQNNALNKHYLGKMHEGGSDNEQMVTQTMNTR